MNDQTSYPLCWPDGWQRTDRSLRQLARFASRGDNGFLRSKSMEEATNFLQLELDRLGVGGGICVLSSNLQLRLDGLPRSGQPQPTDPGAAVYFNFRTKPTVLACDKWNRVEDNVYAIAKHIEAMRGQDRWGVGNLERAFTGYKALPNVGDSAASTWWRVLGVPVDSSHEYVRAAYRELVKAHHPDNGSGDAEQFRRIQEAYEQYERNLDARVG